jgi:DnaJ-class molecular chaperone
MNYTCPQCNGNGIINYDSDLPRYKQQRCALCEGEGVINHNPFPQIKEQLEKARPEWIGQAIQELEKRVERDTGKTIFTAIIMDNDDDLAEDEEESIIILHVFTDKSVMQSFITAQVIGDQMALRIQGNWL